MNEESQKGLNTPYDSAFKSIVKKCPRMSLFLINEMFYKPGLIDEEYDGTERVELLDKELPDLEFGNLELDLRLAVYKSTRRTFHLECQSTSDGTVILKMIQYDTRSALEEADYDAFCIRVKIDDSGIVFLRSTRNTPKVMTVILEVPQGKSVSYQIPVVRMQDYTLGYIIDNKLFILLPFLFFNYEKQLEKVPDDKSLYEEILSLYDTILDRLKELEKSRIITAYEASTLYDALKAVFEALGKTNKAEKEVKSIMGGKILEFSADKYYDAGKTEGVAIGEAKGKAEGKAEGEQKLADLLNVLIANGRIEDIARVASDQEYRASLYKEYAIV
ncbi:MAG: hypothetical protein Q4A32_11175 [Lachnospiraceae bacterium]|nr:hypothetical protein [Lachnospiraceae bacterium]